MPSTTAFRLAASALRAWALIMADRDFLPSATLERFIGRVSHHRPSFYFVLLLGSLFGRFYPAALRGDTLFVGEATPMRTSPGTLSPIPLLPPVVTATSLRVSVPYFSPWSQLRPQHLDGAQARPHADFSDTGHEFETGVAFLRAEALCGSGCRRRLRLEAFGTLRADG